MLLCFHRIQRLFVLISGTYLLEVSAAVLGVTEICFWSLASLMTVKLSDAYSRYQSTGDVVHRVFSYLVFGGSMCLVIEL